VIRVARLLLYDLLVLFWAVPLHGPLPITPANAAVASPFSCPTLHIRFTPPPGWRTSGSASCGGITPGSPLYQSVDRRGAIVLTVEVGDSASQATAENLLKSVYGKGFGAGVPEYRSVQATGTTFAVATVAGTDAPNDPSNPGNRHIGPQRHLIALGTWGDSVYIFYGHIALTGNRRVEAQQQELLGTIAGTRLTTRLHLHSLPTHQILSLSGATGTGISERRGTLFRLRGDFVVQWAVTEDQPGGGSITAIEVDSADHSRLDEVVFQANVGGSSAKIITRDCSGGCTIAINGAAIHYTVNVLA
jgi:hypothetical protein